MPRRVTFFGSLAARLPVAGSGQRIGLMGGSFNPPHAAHVAVAETALKRLRLDAVWWLVTPGNPLKSRAELPPQADRMAACRRLVGQRRIHVTGFEAALGTAYSVSAIAYLRSRRPDVRFVWIMGADNLATFHLWRDWPAIAALLPIAVVDRPGFRIKGLASPAGRLLGASRLPEARAALLAQLAPPAWVLLTNRLSPLSSTSLRRSPP